MNTEEDSIEIKAGVKITPAQLEKLNWEDSQQTYASCRIWQKRNSADRILLCTKTHTIYFAFSAKDSG